MDHDEHSDNEISMAQTYRAMITLITAENMDMREVMEPTVVYIDRLLTAVSASTGRSYDEELEHFCKCLKSVVPERKAENEWFRQAFHSDTDKEHEGEV